MAELLATLLPHQDAALAWCLEREDDGCILADDMGLGKTVTTCALMCRRMMTTLIIAPLALLDQWKSEIEKHTAGLIPHIYHGSKRLFPANMQPGTVVITNPETVLGDSKRGAHALYSKFERVVVDEAHVYRNRKSKIYGALKDIMSEVECNKMLLTGTPVCNKTDDLITMVSLLNLGDFSELDFWSRISTEEKIEHLQNIRTNNILRRTKEEILAAKLPKKEIITVPITLDTPDLREYTEMKQQWINPVILKIMRLRQCVNDISLIRNEYNQISAKLKYIKDTVTALPEGEKIVIFSQWTTMLHHAQAFISDSGMESVMYHGKMNNEQKNAALAKFKEDPNVRVMFMSLRAGSCGLNLCVANHVIMVEPYFNAAEEKQAIDRVYRIGQTKDVKVHRLYVPNTVESWIHSIQSYKTSISDSILNDLPVENVLERKTSTTESYHQFVTPTEEM